MGSVRETGSVRQPRWARRREHALARAIGPGAPVCAVPLNRAPFAFVLVLFAAATAGVCALLGVLLWFDLQDADRSLGVLLLPAAFLALLYALLLVLLIWSWRHSLLVTTAGLELVEGWRTTRVRWQEVAWIESSLSWRHPGCAVVVLRDGRRITSTVTGPRYTLVNGVRVRDYRPRILPDGSKRYMTPLVDLLIDAHRRSLGL
ncbi:hypothetical protein [Brevibacterium album]|uniref:hypothetical protein n=1 Tax=Brevibacterium album TaxID=417948 RepID=UPI00048E6720|nr:hypothetical protein [Brevibacterium album]